MKLEDFMTNNSLEENSLVLELASTVKLDETAVKVLKNDSPEFIVPMTVMDINGCTNVKYKLVKGYVPESLQKDADAFHDRQELVPEYT